MVIYGYFSSPPPPPVFLEDPMAFLEDKLSFLTGLFEETDPLTIMIGATLTAALLVTATFWSCGGLLSSKPLVAICELTVTGKAGGHAEIASPTVRSPSLGNFNMRSPSAKSFVPERATKVSGCVKLVQVGKTTTIEYHVSGLIPGPHGFNIHETTVAKSDVLFPLKSILADSTGQAKGKVTSNVIKLKGPKSVVGRPFVVHADPEGSTGMRVACGDIKLIGK